MDRLSEAFRSAMSKTMADEVKLALTEMAEEAQQKEQALRTTVAKLQQDFREFEAIRQAEKENRQKEEKRLEGVAEAVRKEEKDKLCDSFSQIDLELKRVTEEKEMEREKWWALGKENRRLLFLLELKEDEEYDRKMAKETAQMIRDAERWDRWTKERESATLTTALSAASIKQQLLIELKQKAGKWMESDTSSTEEIPQVFRSWMLREKWMKLQNNQHYLNDGLQSFCLRKDIEKLIQVNQSKEDEINQRCERKMKHLMAETAAKEEKIQAAALKQKKKLEEKIKKEMEKAHKAEMKIKKRQECEEKKQARKLEKKSKEQNQTGESQEETEIRPRRRFAFWRR